MWEIFKHKTVKVKKKMLIIWIVNNKEFGQ